MTPQLATAEWGFSHCSPDDTERRFPTKCETSVRPIGLAIAMRESEQRASRVRSLRCQRAWLDVRAVEEYDGAMSADAIDAPRARNVLIVANRTAATPALLAEVARQASEGVCRFTLLIPRPYWDADTEESAITLELAIPLLEDAAGGRVEGLVGSEDPFLAVSAALEAGSYDEVIVSTLPARVSHWLHLDLPARVGRLGLPVTVVTAKKADRPLARARGGDHPDA
jgi:hypothetical protein